jgi:protein transport protein SEC31
LIATGTKAGAVDADFSNDTTLELWELNLDSSDQDVELQPIATVNADSRHASPSLLYECGLAGFGTYH